MSQYFAVHPTHPQARLLRAAATIIRDGGVVAYPTDSTYALGCHIGDKRSLERIRAIRRLEDDHRLTLACRDLSEISLYARVDNTAYRILKRYTPGPYTFLLLATREVPRRLLHKRKRIGLRVPDHPVASGLLEELGEPMMTTSLILPGDELPLSDGEEIRERLQKQVDAVLDCGSIGVDTTTVVDLTGPEPELIRAGLGEFEL
ncbi:MAG: L-threonylcarbamoyladenylate synthase [Pseudomonadaceae bacterium]|nr:L-threonylcarbamoyladenylate synthase [Pseudomonadaceae bacterium]